MPERPIRIQDLVLEEPERTREFYFDPEKEITKKDWKEMGAALEDWSTREQWGSFFALATAMRLLSPQRTAAFPLREERMLEILREPPSTMEVFDFTETQLILEHYLPRAMQERILLPQHYRPKSHIDVWERGKRYLQTLIQEKKWGMFAYNATQLSFLFPERSTELPLSNEVREGLKEELERLRGEGKWDHFTTLAGKIKLFFPELLQTFQLRQNEWRAMQHSLNDHRQKAEWEEFGRMAMSMYFFTADEVRVTDKGIEVIMRKPKPDTAVPPLPETPRFKV